MVPVVLFFQSTTRKSWRDKLAGVYRFAQEAGWQVQVVASDASAADVRATLALWQPIGCIVDRAMTLGRTPVRIFGETPVAFLDQNPSTSRRKHFPTVLHDSAATARLGAEELLRSGARSFTYVPWTKPAFWSDERERAFARAVRAAGRTYLRWTGDIRNLSTPCGVLCANDIVAQRTMAEAVRLGRRIPEDLLFVGIDDDPLICEHTQPPLSSVLPDFEGAGYKVAALLQEAIDGKRPRQLAYGPVRLVRRASSRWFEKHDPRVMKALAYIREHVFEPELKTDAIIREMGCSRRLADLRFREVTGHSIRDEIHALRMERAFILLRDPRQAIGPIPNLCGYASVPFFKRLFKKTTGLTMREWRSCGRNLAAQPLPA